MFISHALRACCSTQIHGNQCTMVGQCSYNHHEETSSMEHVPMFGPTNMMWRRQTIKSLHHVQGFSWHALMRSTFRLYFLGTDAMAPSRGVTDQDAPPAATVTNANHQPVHLPEHRFPQEFQNYKQWWPTHKHVTHCTQLSLSFGSALVTDNLGASRRFCAKM